MRNRRRLYSVLGVTGLALFLIANHGRPEGVSQAPEESRTASRAETPEAPNRPTPATNGKAWPVRWVHRQTSFNSTDPADLASVLDVVIRGREWGLNGVVVADPKFFKLDIAEEDGGADRNRFLANLAEFMRECESDPDKPIDVILFVPVRSKAQAILASDDASWVWMRTPKKNP